MSIADPIASRPATGDPSIPGEAVLAWEEQAVDAGLVLRHLSGTIGTEITGLDASRPLPDDVRDAVRQVWLARRVVFFPEQHLDPGQHRAFAAEFGEPSRAHPVIPGLDGHPDVLELDYSKSEELAKAYGQIAERRGNAPTWHTDVTFVARPPLGSILNAVSIPPAGGDTLWSDQVAAFRSLSPTLQAFLRTLTAVHDGTDQFSTLLEIVGSGEWEGRPFTLEPSEHPVVRTHPETGEEILFVNPGFTSHIVGLSRPESDHLLAYLYAQATKDEHVVRYKWTEGTLGFWDNRATQHAVVADFTGHRAIHRVTLRGDEPR
jgi:taurine dioxygenase